MENPQLTQENEIDLREYIRAIVKRKKLILSLFSIAVIAAAAFSFNTPKSYKATATIMITPSAIQSVLSTSKGILDIGKNDTTDEDKVTPWNISVATHVHLLKSNLVLERVIKRLNLKDASGKSLTTEVFSKKLNIMKTVGESVMELEVSDANPQEAQDIANAWAEQYVEYSQELILGEINGIGDFVMTQFETSDNNLIAAEKKVNEFKKGYKQDLMAAELAMKKDTLNNYKKELEGIGVVLQTKEDNLIELKKQLAKQKRIIILSKAITDDALWQMSSKVDDITGLEKKGLRSEAINPIYEDLEKRIVNGDIEAGVLKAREENLGKSIQLLTQETSELDDLILQKDFELVQLTRQVDIFKRSYDDFSNKIQASRITKEEQLGEVKIVSPASIPDFPVAQGRIKKVALAGILSLILGLFLALFIEFWKKGTERKI